MQPRIALLLCSVFVLFLLWRDHRKNPDASGALWLPLIWMMLLGSRYVSTWLDMGVRIESPEDYLDGSPLDSLVFAVLIVAATVVLARRTIDWNRIIGANAAIVLFVAYCGLSALWSDYPVVTIKRVIKLVGSVEMALIIITDRHPVQALKTIFKRCGYVLIPFSVVLIKYFPQGRGYNRFSWITTFRGVATDKNALGYLCLTCGYFFFWSLAEAVSRLKEKAPVDRIEALVHGAQLLMTLWLFSMAQSSTSLMCFIVGAGLIVLLGSYTIRRNFTVIALVAAVSAALIESTFDVSKAVIEGFLKRDTTLTGRTDLWKELLTMKDVNPLFGTGYDSFWLGERAQHFWEIYWWHPNQAHNGFLEVYINLGLVGLLLLVWALVSIYRKSNRELSIDANYGRFRVGFFVIMLLYNFTEAAFKGMHLMWFVFLIIALEYVQEPVFSGILFDVPQELREYARDADADWEGAGSRH